MTYNKWNDKINLVNNISNKQIKKYNSNLRYKITQTESVWMDFYEDKILNVKFILHI